jgi:hypothetical protein
MSRPNSVEQRSALKCKAKEDKRPLRRKTLEQPSGVVTLS